MRFRFIQEQSEQYNTRLMCKALSVSTSGYYAWRTRPVSAREMENQRLYDLIKAVYED